MEGRYECLDCRRASAVGHSGPYIACLCVRGHHCRIAAEERRKARRFLDMEMALVKASRRGQAADSSGVSGRP